MGVNSLPKTVARQRRDCDLNPGPSAPESSKLTTRLPTKPQVGPTPPFPLVSQVAGSALGLGWRRTQPPPKCGLCPPPDLAVLLTHGGDLILRKVSEFGQCVSWESKNG